MDAKTVQNLINNRLIFALSRIRCKICYSKFSNNVTIDIPNVNFKNHRSNKLFFQIDKKPLFLKKHLLEIRLILNERDYNYKNPDIFRKIWYVDNVNRKSGTVAVAEIQCNKCKFYYSLDTDLEVFFG